VGGTGADTLITSKSGDDCTGMFFEEDVGESSTIAIGEEGTGGRTPIGAGRRLFFSGAEVGTGGRWKEDLSAVLGGGGRLKEERVPVARGVECLKEVFQTGAEGSAFPPKPPYRG
jgi:hypothetical protein